MNYEQMELELLDAKFDWYYTLYQLDNLYGL